MKLKKILCPIDFSEASLKGLTEAAKYALHFDAELCLAHVVFSGIPMAADAVGYLTLSAEIYDIPCRHAEEKLRELLQELNDRGVRASFLLAAGEAGCEIVRLAQELPADLIVMATHSGTGWRHILFGSVTEKVVRQARCQVLTVPIHRRPPQKIQGKLVLVTPLVENPKRLAAAACRRLIRLGAN